MNNISLNENKTLWSHEDKVWAICWHPIDQLIASCGSDKRIMIWNSKGECLAVLDDCHSRTIRSLSWDFSGCLLAAASFDSTITVWKKKKNQEEQIIFECIASLEGHESEVKSVSFSVSGQYLASCSRDKSIWIWDIEEEGDFSCNNVLQGHTQDVKMVKWSPKEDVLFSCSYDDTIKVWKFEESQEDWICVNTLKGHTSTVWALEMSKNGKFFISCSDDQSLILWSIIGNNYKEIKIIKQISQAHDRAILSLSLNLNDSMLVTGSSDNTISIWSIEHKEENINVDHGGPKDLRHLLNKEAHDEDVNCVIFGRSENSSNLLATCSDDGCIKFWSIKM
jgi:WD40 repeat protein